MHRAVCAALVGELTENLDARIGENTRFEFESITNSGATRTITLKSNYAEMLYFSATVTSLSSAFLREVTFIPPNIVKYKFNTPDNSSAVTSGISQTYMFVGK